MSTLVGIERGESLSQQVYDQLRQALIRGAFKPGEQITIRSLAKIMNVSPTPAREALNRLAIEGALEFGSNRSLWVPRMAADRVRELYAIRIPLEEMLVRSAFPHLTAKDIEALSDLLAARVKALDEHDYRSSLELNMAFSFIIFRKSTLPITLRIVENLWLLVGPTMNLFYPELNVDRVGISLHRMQIDAIRQNDVETCLQAMHLENNGMNIILSKLGHTSPLTGVVQAEKNTH